MSEKTVESLQFELIKKQDEIIEGLNRIVAAQDEIISNYEKILYPLEETKERVSHLRLVVDNEKSSLKTIPRIDTTSPEIKPNLCACLGPQGNDPLCPCAMINVGLTPTEVPINRDALRKVINAIAEKEKPSNFRN